MDVAIDAIHRRFLTHGTLIGTLDLAWLDPRRFEEVRAVSLPDDALKNLSMCLLKVDSRASVNELQSELKSR